MPPSISTPILTDDDRSRATDLIAEALGEDLDGAMDHTTCALVPEEATGRVNIVARQRGVVSGNPLARMVFESLDRPVLYETLVPDGESVEPGTLIATIRGPMRELLVGERTALNFLTLLSGTATLTRRFVEAASGTSAKILDTRKTLPGLRALQKYAVRCGGGENHRIGLFDAVLIKDNHLAWWTKSGRTLAEAVTHARSLVPAGLTIEIEVDSLEQLAQVLPAAPDIVLVDNYSIADLRMAIALRNDLAPGVQLEASGGVNLDTVVEIAKTGVDRISVGALTHSAPALDIGVDWNPDS
ncbi:MAG: carboxylating nicotinate-nucleotide diphosphorylase [Planctomycetaceae bacterium]|nr:carboxylating nicotinate-nucleotide diphosphorylase [Planctomycetaceae bacterium]